ncbi:MAG: magnesium chelatase domain-containing protein [Syntrophales bacterium]
MQATASPRHHITVNLAPADIRKQGTAFDLPIAREFLPPRGSFRKRSS